MIDQTSEKAEKTTIFSEHVHGMIFICKYRDRIDSEQK